MMYRVFAVASIVYYKTVYPALRLSSMFVWEPYTAVKTTETGETGSSAGKSDCTNHYLAAC